MRHRKLKNGKGFSAPYVINEESIGSEATGTLEMMILHFEAAILGIFTVVRSGIIERPNLHLSIKFQLSGSIRRDRVGEKKRLPYQWEFWSNNESNTCVILCYPSSWYFEFTGITMKILVWSTLGNSKGVKKLLLTGGILEGWNFRVDAQPNGMDVLTNSAIPTTKASKFFPKLTFLYGLL